jgi:hypothetical protein
MVEPTMFAEAFTLADTVQHTRCAKPVGHLTPSKHLTMTLPGDLGRATLDYYATPKALYARVVSMQTGEVVWYEVTSRAPSPERSADIHTPHTE